MQLCPNTPTPEENRNLPVCLEKNIFFLHTTSFRVDTETGGEKHTT
jgi:hypothetical protein